MRPAPALPISLPFSADRVLCDALSPHHRLPTVDEALKLNIEDKEESSPRRPPAKRARPAEEQVPPAVPAESSPEASSRPKRKAAPPPATEGPVKGRGKKAKTDAAPSTAAAPPASKGKKSGAEKKAAGKADEEAAAREQQEADEVDALADEPAENGAADSADQGTHHPLRNPLCAPC